jgi:hypothetical protein
VKPDPIVVVSERLLAGSEPASTRSAPRQVEIEPEPPIEDRNVVVAAASPDGWTAVDGAEYSLMLKLAMRDGRIRGDRTRRQ